MLFANLTDLSNRLDGADLIVGGHDRDKTGVLADRLFQLIQTDDAILVNGQESDLKAVFFELVQRVQNRVVLKRARNDVRFTLLLSVESGGQERLIVRFTAAGGEDNLSRICVDNSGDFLTRDFKLFLCLLADGVQARRIAVPVSHTVRHCLNRRLAHFGGGGVVRVYLHNVSSFLSMILL